LFKSLPKLGPLSGQGQQGEIYDLDPNTEL